MNRWRRTKGKTGGWAAVVAGVCLCLSNGPVLAQGHDALKPLLVDLDDWQGLAVQGSTMDMGTYRVITAIREYVSGDRALTASIVIGDGTVTAGPAAATTVETDAAVARCHQIEGYQVFSSYEKASGQGTVVVSLDQGRQMGAVFTLDFIGLSEAEAVDLAQSFDWDQMKALSQSLY